MAGISAFGTYLKLGRGDTSPGPETFDTIANVTEFGGPGMGVDEVETTAHDSPGAYEEKIATIIRLGELSLSLNYDPTKPTHSAIAVATVDGLLSAMVARKKVNLKLGWPSSPAVEWVLHGYVTGFEPGAPFDDKLTADVTISLSGAPTFA